MTAMHQHLVSKLEMSCWLTFIDDLLCHVLILALLLHVH